MPQRPLVQRLCGLLPCLSSGALLGAGSGRLRQLLCAAAQCPALLAWDEGVRLVAELLGSPALRMPAHAALKAVLPTVSKQQALNYGQAYYRAWRLAETADREVRVGRGRPGLLPRLEAGRDGRQRGEGGEREARPTTAPGG